ncbi:MAG: LysR substrate-binding domain-containing protein [Rhodospirillaceae bacterium]
MDRLTALTAFRTVVEQGSFAAAARHLGLSRAAISKNVADLETELAVRLLNRTTRRLSLTEAGALYFERVVRILDELADADGTLKAMQYEPSGTLRVTAPLTLSLLRLSQKIPDFLERYPKITLDLRLEDRRVNIIEEGIDIALRGTNNLESSGLIARKLTVMEHVVCAAPSYFAKAGTPLTPTDLAQHRAVQFSLSDHAQEWRFRKTVDGGTGSGTAQKEEKVRVDGRYKVSSSLAVIDALRAGFGLSLVPRMYVTEDLANGNLVQALEDWSANTTTLYAVYPSKRYVVSTVRVFLDFLIAELGA